MTLETLSTFKTHWKDSLISPIKNSFELSYKKAKFSKKSVNTIVLLKQNIPLCCQFRVQIVHKNRRIRIPKFIVNGESIFNDFEETGLHFDPNDSISEHTISFELEFPSTKSMTDSKFDCIPMKKCFGIKDGILHAAFIDIGCIIPICENILANEDCQRDRYVFRFRIMNQNFKWRNMAVPFVRNQDGQWMLTTKGFNMQQLCEFRMYSDCTVKELLTMKSERYQYSYCEIPPYALE
jgi:hypothetical protein